VHFFLALFWTILEIQTNRLTRLGFFFFRALSMADIKRFSLECGKNVSSVPDLFDWKDIKVGNETGMFITQDVCMEKGKNIFQISRKKFKCGSRFKSIILIFTIFGTIIFLLINI
jgi:hypothetical protein